MILSLVYDSLEDQCSKKSILEPIRQIIKEIIIMAYKSVPSRLTVIFCLLILSLFLICSCGGGGGGGGANDKLLASATIGSDGGTVETEELVLTVPAGAFTSDTELKVYKSSDENPFSKDAVSSILRVDGLPDAWSQTLQIKIKYKGNLSGERFIAVGEDAFMLSAGETATAFSLLEAETTNGYLTIDLAAPSGSQTISQGLVSAGRISDTFTILKFFGTTRKTKKSSSGHFQITYPVKNTNLSDVNALADYLDDAYVEFERMGFDYSKRTKWPAQVNLIDLNVDGRYGYPAWFGINYGVLDLNVKNLADRSRMRYTAGHEFFHLVQSLYGTRNEWYWPDEAFSTWSETLFVSNPDDYIPSTVLGPAGIVINNFWEPFKGWQKGSEGNDQNHGYGMSPVIKYLTKKYNNKVLVDIYKANRAGRSPMWAIEDSVPDHISFVCALFFDQYLLGNLYNIPINRFARNRTGTYHIGSAKDTGVKFPMESYPDLSAKLYQINLKYPGISNDAKIELTTSGDQANIFVYKFKTVDGSWVVDYIIDGIDNVTVEDIKDLTDEKYFLLVMIINTSRAWDDYTATTDIALDVNVVTTQATKFSVGIDAYLSSITTVEGSGSSQSTQTKDQEWKNFFVPTGTIAGATYTGSYSYQDSNGWQRDSEIILTVSGDQGTVTSFTATSKTEAISQYVGPYTLISTLKGTNVPFEKAGSGQTYNDDTEQWEGYEYELYSVHGTQTCQSLIEYTQYDSRIDKSTSFTCDSGSKLEIELQTVK
jgi:hypothetical protein